MGISVVQKPNLNWMNMGLKQQPGQDFFSYSRSFLSSSSGWFRYLFWLCFLSFTFCFCGLWCWYERFFMGPSNLIRRPSRVILSHISSQISCVSSTLCLHTRPHNNWLFFYFFKSLSFLQERCSNLMLISCLPLIQHSQHSCRLQGTKLYLF